MWWLPTDFSYARSKFDNKTLAIAKKLAQKRYFVKNLLEFIGPEGDESLILNSKEKECESAFYLKWRYCIHSIALNNLLNNKRLVTKTKRGRKKNVGRFPTTAKALEFD